MDSIINAGITYFVVLILIRLTGRRTLSEMTTFDFVLLLIVSESIQEGMIREDYSLTNAFLVVVTLLGLDVLFSKLKMRWPVMDKWLSGIPMIIVENGRPIYDLMKRARVDEEDVLEAARTNHGLERMEQIKYAVLERDGSISIVPETQWMTRR